MSLIHLDVIALPTPKNINMTMYNNNGKHLTICFKLNVLSMYEGYENCIIKIFTNPRCLLLLYKYDIVYVIYAILLLTMWLCFWLIHLKNVVTSDWNHPYISATTVSSVCYLLCKEKRIKWII